MSGSVKGSIIAGVVEDLLALKRTGALSDDLIGASLDAADVKLIEDKATPSAWYPMASYTRLLELLYAVEADGQDRQRYFEGRGEKNAQRLFEAGLYQQLSFVDRWAEDATEGRSGSDAVAAFGRNLRLVLTLSSSIYQGGVWSVEPDPDNDGRLVVAVADAGDYSAPMRWAALGFLNECARPRDGSRPALFIGHLDDARAFRFKMSMDIEGMHPAHKGYP